MMSNEGKWKSTLTYNFCLLLVGPVSIRIRRKVDALLKGRDAVSFDGRLFLIFGHG